ncbi:MAG: hypothetical protein FWD71_15405 [Oscillospiraceae bacterium]|nr:hypothetical protein [Oscillospiraceae bacterium]
MKLSQNHRCAIKRILFIFFTFLFLLAMTSSIFSCNSGNSGNGNNNSNNQTGDNSASGAAQPDSASTTEEPHTYPQLDGGGADFKIFTPINTWFYYTAIDHEQMTGDALDDAVYNRNRAVEAQFNINIKEVDPASNDMWNFNPEVKKVILAGDDTYDAIFVPASFNGTIGSMITANMFYDLRQIPTINLSGDWWNQTMLKQAAIGTGDKIFYLGSGIDLMELQAVSCVYFNQDMMTNLGLDLPYNLVRQGKWTYDAFQTYMKAGTNLNGATNFTWDQSGTAVYGLTSYEDSSTALLAGSGEQFITADADGKPVLAIGGERFMNALTKIKTILNTQNGNFLYANDSDNIFHYEPIFKSGRALMCIGELKSADVFRDMNATFGVVPIPKYDETQAGYYSHLINQTPVLVIPVTNPRTDLTGAVLDAMAYVSNRDVTPVLFDVSVSQKQLRNDDSVEMLQLMKNSASFEIGAAYGWTNTLYDKLRTTIGEGKDLDIAAEIDKDSGQITANIQKTLDQFQQ